MTDPYLRDDSGRIVALVRDNIGIPVRPFGPWNQNITKVSA